MIVTATVLQAILAGLFLLAGATKLLGAKMQVENFTGYGYPEWFRLVTGGVEVAGAALMVVGVFIPEAGIAGGLWLAATMTGAVYTDLFRTPSPARAAAPAVLLIMAIAVVVLRVLEVTD
ncbi:MAG: DoxX family protein [Dehalococcoidia bacterium]|nr:MAG: DoxX family protein [Dehalococcoidia bacterium]